MSQLADYQFDIKYRPGKQNIDADYLSRHPVGVFEKRMKSENKVIHAEDVGMIFSEASQKERISCMDLNVFATDVTAPPEGVQRITLGHHDIYIGIYRDISVYRYLPIFTDIYRYLPIFYRYLPIFTDISDIYRYVPIYMVGGDLYNVLQLASLIIEMESG